MPTALVTGSGGLVGSESVAHLIESGFHVIGLENDMRARFFGREASTGSVSDRLVDAYGDEFERLDVDIRDSEAVRRTFASARNLSLVVHAAAQPSHDWAASDPQVDFGVNANGTLNLLQAARDEAPDATFVYLSTNKVYGDTPNHLPLVDAGARLELPADHRWHGGIDTSMSIDRSMHSLFGVSKLAADLMVQEYGRYFDMPTVCFRCGCLTGPNHAGAKLHGFLSYLMRCTMTGERYTVFGYEGKQVRDNLHSADLVRAFTLFHSAPRAGAVYNLGGGRASNCSVLEAIDMCERISGRELDWDAVGRGAHGRPPLVDLRPRRVHPRLPGVPDRARRRVRAARHPRPERGAVERSRLSLSVVMPAYNEAGSIGQTVGAVAGALRAEGVDYEVIVVDDASADGTAAAVEAAADGDARIRCVRSHNPRGFGYAIRSGLDLFTKDAVAIVMADGSDSPGRPGRLLADPLRRLRLRVRLALHARRAGTRLPPLQARP